MKVKINYTIDGIEDSFIVEGKDLIEIKDLVATEMLVRKLDNSNNCWSEIIE